MSYRTLIFKSVCLGNAVVPISVTLGVIIKIKSAESLKTPDYLREKGIVDPDAFITGDLVTALPYMEYTDELVYSEEANPILKKPAADLTGVDVLVIPKQITDFEAVFFERFPRLEYIVWDEANSRFLSRDGILYRRETPLQVVAVSPKLHGTIVLPEGITQLAIPWCDAQFRKGPLAGTVRTVVRLP